MKVASMDLCCELHELSGWGVEDADITKQWSRNGAGGWFIDGAYPWVHEGQIPGYDLGFLMRKLETVKSTFDTYAIDLRFSLTTRQWQCALSGLRSVQPASGDSPEDAACKYAIKLIKAHVLSRSLTNN